MMIDDLPPAMALLGDKGYDADWFHYALAQRGIEASIPRKLKRKGPIPRGHALYRERHKIEDTFGRIKDWRRIHTHDDRCAYVFMSAICIAATVISWL